MSVAWTNQEVAKLRALYSTASWEQIEAALPRHGRVQIRATAARWKLQRRVDPRRDVRHPWVKLLRERRLALGLSQGELAKRINVERTLIVHREGKRASGLPGAEMLQRWANALGFRLDLIPTFNEPNRIATAMIARTHAQSQLSPES